MFDPSRQPFDFLSGSRSNRKAPPAAAAAVSPSGSPASSTGASSGQSRLQEFTAIFRGPVSLGLKIRARAPGVGQIVVRQVLDSGAATAWNTSPDRGLAPETIIRPGDVIVAIGGTTLTGPDGRKESEASLVSGSGFDDLFRRHLSTSDSLISNRSLC